MGSDQRHAVLVYQHFSTVKRNLFVGDKAKKRVERCGVVEIVALRTANVLFLLAPQERHRDALAEGAEKVCRRWEGQIVISRHRSA